MVIQFKNRCLTKPLLRRFHIGGIPTTWANNLEDIQVVIYILISFTRFFLNMQTLFWVIAYQFLMQKTYKN